MGGFLDLFTKIGLFPGVDERITTSTPKQSRSESALAINPNDPANLIAVSKRFIDPAKYHFTVAPVFKKSGSDWTEATLPNPSNWDGLTDPVVAFDHHGTAFLVAEPLRFDPDDITVIGMQVFKSTNKGQSWSNPTSLIQGRAVDGNDDKSWITCDRGPASPYKGRIYVAWAVGGALRLARSLDGGNNWIGAGALPAGADVPGVPVAWAPEINVGEDGVVHVVWYVHSSGTSIRYCRSTDGGNTFSAPVDAVTGVVSLNSNTLPGSTGSWPEFPGGKFRVLTLATGTTLTNRFVVAWSDMREGHARIYYRVLEKTTPSTWTWLGPANGQPLLPSLASSANVHHFHPQLAATGSGVVSCAFYEFGTKGDGKRIDTRLAASWTKGDSFDWLATVTDAPWDPATNAPPSHGNPQDTFIGEYFGFDADASDFAAVWTDTRTGVQELFYDRVATTKVELPDELRGIWAKVFGGVANDGGGFVIVNGKFIRVPPRGPKYAILQSLIALDSVEEIEHPAGAKLVGAISEAIGSIARDLGKAAPAHLAATVETDDGAALAPKEDGAGRRRAST